MKTILTIIIILLFTSCNTKDYEFTIVTTNSNNIEDTIKCITSSNYNPPYLENQMLLISGRAVAYDVKRFSVINIKDITPK